MHFNGWMHKQTVIYTCHEILCSIKKEWTIDTQDLEKPTYKGYILYDFLYIPFLNWQNYKDIE